MQPGITIPDGVQSITIGKDGVVTAQLAGQAAPTQIGTLQLVDFINPAGLQPKGENLLVESAASGAPQTGTPGLNGLGYIEQGSLEASNVNVGGRAGEHDRNPARLRDELEGDLDHGSDAPVSDPESLK